MNAYEAVKAARTATGSEAAAQRPPGACAAHGCPCAGSLDLGSTGRFFCPWHAWAIPDRWGEITEQLHAHKWLVDFIGELLRLRDARKGPSWVDHAREYFAAQPDLQPTANEARNLSVYVWLLREELGYRIGVRKDPPAHRVPQSETMPDTRAMALERA